MLKVQDGRDVERGLAWVQNGVRLDVAGHTIDDMRHGLAGIRVESVVVDDGSGVDGLVGTEREQPLVPMDMAEMWVSKLVYYVRLLLTYPDRYASTPY